MCYLSLEVQQITQAVVTGFLEGGAPFTGHDVAKLVRSMDQVLVNEDPRHISSYVRELFNDGQMPGWASTQVIPKSGPVMYFKISRGSKAWKKASEIREAMKPKPINVNG